MQRQLLLVSTCLHSCLPVLQALRNYVSVLQLLAIARLPTMSAGLELLLSQSGDAETTTQVHQIVLA